MRYPYAPQRLTAAARALDGGGAMRERLFAAFQNLHTLLPEHLPDGELSRRFAQLHARFTNAHPRDVAEQSVWAVLADMPPEEMSALAAELRRLASDVQRDAQRRRL